MIGAALRIARRELRGGVRGLRLVVACLALGVAAIAAVGTLRAGVEAGLAADSARILGGDVEIRLGARPLAEEARAWLAARATLSEVVTLRAMAVAPSGQRMLVELKAVDEAWPLYGEPGLAPMPGQAGAGGGVAGGPEGIWLDPLVIGRLGLSAGDRVRIGEASFPLLGAVAAEPDRIATIGLMAPRALIPRRALAATGLVTFGSLAEFDVRLRLPAGADVRGFVAALRAQPFVDSGWRIRTADRANAQVNRFLDQAASFLMLAGLSALLVGGIGVATGVRAWLAARARSIATLRCLGATSRLVFAAYLAQLLALAVVGILVGLAAGVGLAHLAAGLLDGALPVPPRLGLYPGALGLAALYGVLVALVFSLPALGRAARVPGAALFRDPVAPAGEGAPGAVWGLTGVLAAALAALVVFTAENPAFALGFVAAAGGTIALFRAGAWALAAAARALRHVRRPALRLGLANLHRPGAPTGILLVSLGIGLTVLSAVALVEGNLRRALTEQASARTPNFFVLDLQAAEAAAFDALAAALPGVEEVRRVPSLRARVVAVKGVPAEAARVTPDTAWALRGDRGLTYAATPPPGTRIVAGQWWDAGHRGPPLVSFDAAIARGWGVGVGDSITVNVLGRDIELRIANLRDIEWRSFGMNFTMIASPGLLEAAPHTHIATLRGDPARDGEVLRAVTDAFPHVSMIRVREALEAVAAILSRIGTALSATGSVTLLAGALVLAGAVAATQARRVRDAVILKTLGATRGQIARAFLVEFGLLGLVAGVLAAGAGTAASWAVTTRVMRAEWVFLPGVLALAVAGCVALTLAFGYAGTALALRARAAPLLRNE
ncbi:MAG: ABC transporter permease [Acetobacteraceae bacterium]|nr:ABC transporter permease [Acetobacteraceae bacterium]